MLENMIFGALCVVVASAIYLIVKRFKSGGRWGVNLAETRCPRCGTVVSFFRNPKSAQQMMWGGWTCTNCGCEMDRWGKEIAKP